MKVAASTSAELSTVVEMWESRGWQRATGSESVQVGDLWVIQLQRPLIVGLVDPTTWFDTKFPGKN